MTKISNQYSLTNILTADLANSRLGINNVSPTVALDVTGAGKFSGSVTSDDLLLTAGTLFSAGNTGFSNRLSDTTLYLQMPATGFNITDNALNTRFILSSAGIATFTGAKIQPNQTEIFPTAGASNRAYAFNVCNVAAGDFTISQGSTATGGTYTTRLIINPSGVVTITNLGSGAVTATSGVLSTTSDMTLKNEDGYIDNALEKISQLKPRYFYWKEESGLPTDIRQLGFYAQEVNQALGEEAANTPKNENDKWGIYDRGIIAMLTKAVQELSAKVSLLENK